MLDELARCHCGLALLDEQSEDPEKAVEEHRRALVSGRNGRRPIPTSGIRRPGPRDGPHELGVALAPGETDRRPRGAASGDRHRGNASRQARRVPEIAGVELQRPREGPPRARAVEGIRGCASQGRRMLCEGRRGKSQRSGVPVRPRRLSRRAGDGTPRWSRELDAAAAEHRRAIAIEEKLVAGHAEYRRRLAWSYQALGWVLNESQRPLEAADAYRKSIEAYRKAAAERRDDPGVEDRLAWSRKGLAMALRNQKDTVAADEEYRAAIGIWEKLVTKFPARYEYQVELAWCHQQRGDLMGDRKDRKGLDQEYGLAIAASEQLIAARPGVSEYKMNLSQIHHNYGLALRDLLGTTKARSGNTGRRSRSARRSSPRTARTSDRGVGSRGATTTSATRSVPSRIRSGPSGNQRGNRDPRGDRRRATRRRDACAALAMHYRSLGAAFYDQDDAGKASAAYGKAIAILEGPDHPPSLEPEYRAGSRRGTPRSGLRVRVVASPRDRARRPSNSVGRWRSIGYWSASGPISPHYQAELDRYPRRSRGRAPRRQG